VTALGCETRRPHRTVSTLPFAGFLGQCGLPVTSSPTGIAEPSRNHQHQPPPAATRQPTDETGPRYSRRILKLIRRREENFRSLLPSSQFLAPNPGPPNSSLSRRKGEGQAANLSSQLASDHSPLWHQRDQQAHPPRSLFSFLEPSRLKSRRASTLFQHRSSSPLTQNGRKGRRPSFLYNLRLSFPPCRLPPQQPHFEIATAPIPSIHCKACSILFLQPVQLLTALPIPSCIPHPSRQTS
jgi:hypothetical protein